MNKGYAYGMSADVQRKIDAKRDVKQEGDIQAWVEAITGEKFEQDVFENNLCNGVLLCKCANKIKPGAFKFTANPKMPFKIMENIELFLKFCEGLGMKKTDVFPVASLYEKTNIPQVCGTIVALGRLCQDLPQWDENSSEFKDWPFLGPRQSHENKREFDEKTIQEGKKIIGMQAGTNKLASQAGSAFGGKRQINIEEGPRS